MDHFSIPLLYLLLPKYGNLILMALANQRRFPSRTRKLCPLLLILNTMYFVSRFIHRRVLFDVQLCRQGSRVISSASVTMVVAALALTCVVKARNNARWSARTSFLEEFRTACLNGKSIRCRHTWHNPLQFLCRFLTISEEALFKSPMTTAQSCLVRQVVATISLVEWHRCRSLLKRPLKSVWWWKITPPLVYIKHVVFCFIGTIKTHWKRSISALNKLRYCFN